MKYLIYFFIVIALAGCKEEDAALRFTQITNSNPAGIIVDYFSPDPLHCAKSYEIRANAQGGRLVLKCTNHDDIIVVESSLAGGTYTDIDGAYSVSYAKNEITIVFSKKTETDADTKAYYSHINIIGAEDRGDLQTNITIIRLFDDIEP